MIRKLFTAAIVSLCIIALAEGVAIGGGLIVLARESEGNGASSVKLGLVSGRLDLVRHDIEELESDKTALNAEYNTLLEEIIGPYSEIISMVEDIRGLSADELIPVYPMTRAELAVYLENDMAENYPPDEIAIDEKCLKALGLLNADASLSEILLGSSTDSYAGFYVPSENKLYIITEDNEVSWYEKYIFAHEYEHFLQDQNWGIDTTQDTFDEDNSDQYLAYTALVEGDSMLTETQFLVRLALYHNDDFVALQEEIANLDYSDSGYGYTMPDYWYDSMYFPYSTGMDFVGALKKNGGWEAVNNAFDAPPVSTEQIIHPEKYFGNDAPVELVKEDRSSSIGVGWALIDQDVLGELYTTYVLWTGNSTADAEDAAAGWDGDRVQFYEDESGDMVVLWESYWDTETDQDEFVDAVNNFLDDIGYYGTTNVADDGKVTVIYGQKEGVGVLATVLF